MDMARQASRSGAWRAWRCRLSPDPADDSDGWPIPSVLGEIDTIHKSCPIADGSGSFTVEKEEVASALLTFVSGVKGSLIASRRTWGRNSRLGFDLHRTQCIIIFDQEQMNELHQFRKEVAKSVRGITKILPKPEHPPYGDFCPAPGHQLGFNDLKVIELAGILRAIRDDLRPAVDFTVGLEIEKAIYDVALSSNLGRCCRLDEM